MSGSQPSRQRRARPTAGRGTTPARPLGTPIHGVPPNTGVLASAAWLAARDLVPSERSWSVEIALDVREGRAPATFDEVTASRFQLEIFAEEWGYRFFHGGRLSWIRVTDVPFAHGRDEHELLRQTPPLARIELLVRRLEERYAIRLNRRGATVRTSLRAAEPVIARWIQTL